MNKRPKNEDPSEILTWPINSWVVGSWYVDVAVNLATTPDWAPIITSLRARSNKPGVDWYVPVVLLKVNLSLTRTVVAYTGPSSACVAAVVPNWPLVTSNIVESLFSVIWVTVTISEPTW